MRKVKMARWCAWGVMGLAILLCLLFSNKLAFAGPANPDPQEFTQPDGTTKFIAFVKGDEFQGWFENEAGYTIIKNPATNFWEFAVKDASGNLTPSGIMVAPDQEPPKGTPFHLTPMRKTYMEKGVGLPPRLAWTPVPVSGNKNLLIILVNFTGIPGATLTTTAAGWDNVIFNTTPGAKSVANFYADNSFGNITVVPVPHSQPGNPPGIVTVTISSPHPNDYPACGGVSACEHAAEIAWINAALLLADPFVNFSVYDTSPLDDILKPNEINVYFILAGYETSAGSGLSPTFWAHAWSEWLLGDVTVEGGTKDVSNWAINGELFNTGIQQPMGVICHEMGHAMAGLPDLYDINGLNEGLGGYSVMGSGSWGRTAVELYGGTTPVSLDAWSREYVAWSAPRAPANGEVLTFNAALAATNSPVKFGGGTEYFLAENRCNTGWDQGLERWLGVYSGGILIQHIDTNVGTPGSNNINSSVFPHQGVLAEEANSPCSLLGAPFCRGHVNHLFWDTNNTAFNGASTPNSNYYSGAASNLGLVNISAPGCSMTGQAVTSTTEVISTPNTPTGTTLGTTGISYNYTTGGSLSNLLHSVLYRFNWGDGSPVSALGAATQSHSYAAAGTYLVTAQAECATDVGVVSAWSTALTVNIVTVSTPTVPTGPTSGSTGFTYTYTTGGSASTPVGFAVQYRFDWSGGVISAWGAATQSHAWSTSGAKAIRAQASLVADPTIVSAWSAALNFNGTTYTALVILNPDTINKMIFNSGAILPISWGAPATMATFDVYYSTRGRRLPVPGTVGTYPIALGVVGTTQNWVVPATPVDLPLNRKISCMLLVIGRDGTGKELGRAYTKHPFKIAP